MLIVLAINKVVPKRWDVLIALALLAALVAATMLLGAKDLGQPGRFGIMRMACEFTAGCLFCRAASSDAMPRTGTLIFAIMLTLIGAYSLQYHWGAVFGLGLLVLALCQESLLVNLLFGNRLALWLGNISFSLYLSHWSLIQVSQWARSRVAVDKDLMAAMLVATIIAIATLLYHLVEVPSRRYLRRKMQTGPTPTSTDGTINGVTAR